MADHMARQRCSATNQRGEQCQKLAIPGGTVCYYHGGAAKQVRAAAKRNVQRGEAERQLKALSIEPRAVDPHEALLEELHHTAGWVDYVRGLVERDGEGGLTQWGMGGRTASALWDILTEQRKHLVATAAACIKAGIEERRVRLAEEQGRLMADAIRRIVAGLGLDPSSPQVREVVRRELTVISGDAA